MNVAELKTQLDLLLSEVVAAALSTGTELRRLRGVALYDSQKDLFITSRSQFAALDSGVRELEQVRELYGIEQSHRIALQLVYEYFARADRLLLDHTLLEKLWVDFVAELDTPVWLTRAVTNLRHFQCKELHVELGDGVAIYGRDSNILAALGFQGGIWEGLAADWSGFGASSFVLVAETTMQKRPDNFVMLDNMGVWLRCARSIGAMRLLAAGDVGMSVAFIQRIARFNVGIGGVLSTGATINTIGNQYIWPSAQTSLYNSTYAALERLERIGYGKAPGNLDLALRAFMSTYDRFPTAMDTKLVDSITALEAVLGTESEITFKLSFRVASLLASTDEQRATLLKDVKGFYDTRSRIVHGDRLGKKHSASLAAVDDLRNIVRTLLCSFVRFAADDARSVGKKFFAEELDAVLVSAKSREDLRVLLGLVEQTPVNVTLGSRAQ